MKKINIVIIFFAFIIYCYIINIVNIPKKVYISNDDKFNINLMPGIEVEEIIETSNNGNSSLEKQEYSIFGIKIKDVLISKIEKVELSVLGNLIGMRLYTNGVLVVGTSNIEDINKEIKLQKEIIEGDTIISINNISIDSIEEINEIVNKSNGEILSCEIVRDGRKILTNIEPIMVDENEYKLGLWVKEAATGVGTISFINKDTNEFLALGHGITDSDTGRLLDINTGEIVLSKIKSIKKGKAGDPGEIEGKVIDNSIIGLVTKNTEFGIIGNIIDESLVEQENIYKVSTRDKINIGDASILCDVDGNVKEYDIKILSVDIDNNFDNKSMIIEVVDKDLIKKTGGIVRGMSGCPVIQNGKVIGIITNVLISDPKVGYAVFIDLVLNEM